MLFADKSKPFPIFSQAPPPTTWEPPPGGSLSNYTAKQKIIVILPKNPVKSDGKSEDQPSAEQDRADGVADESDHLVRRFVGVTELQANAVIERIEERELFSGHDVEDEVGQISNGEAERKFLIDHGSREGIKEKPDERMREGSVVGAIPDQPKNDEGDQPDRGRRLIFIDGFTKSEPEKEVNDDCQKHGFERHQMTQLGVGALERIVIRGHAAERACNERNHAFTDGFGLQNDKRRCEPYGIVRFAHHGTIPPILVDFN